MKTDEQLMRNGVPLRVDGLVKGAKMAVEQGLSFDEYCEMVTKVIISGQPLWLVKMILQKMEIHTLFGVCPECSSTLERLDDDKGFCVTCGFDNLPVLENGGVHSENA